MSDSRKHQVNLRGATTKEITRDALLEKVNQERELRNYMRRANAAVLLIQRGWRRYQDTKTAALRIQKDWEVMMKNYVGVPTRMMISSDILRPFLFFVEYLCVRYGKIGDRERDCMFSCFRVMLESISANDVHHNFCSMTTGRSEEKKIWFLQTKKLISICLFILSVFGSSCQRMQDVVLTSMAMRLAVLLTDPNGWKCTIGEGFQDAYAAVKSLMQYVGNKTTGLYRCIRKYFYKLDGPIFSLKTLTSPTDDRFLIVASAVTLLLRPFHIANLDSDDNGLMESAIEQYCILMLTIPWFPQRLPSVLVPALRHKSVLSPCLRTFLISKEKILREISELDQLKVTSKSKIMPGVGWALANIVYLATNGDVSSVDSGKFPEGLDCASYLHLAALLIDNLLDSLGSFGWIKGQNKEIQGDDDNTVESFQLSDEMTCRFSSFSYMDHFRPVYQQWHLHKLLTFEKYTSVHGADNIQPHNQDYLWNFEILNVAYFYSSMIRLFSAINPSFKSLPILNMLSFTPGFLSILWGELEKCLFPSESRVHSLKPSSANMISGRDGGVSSDRQQKRFNRENSNKLMSVLHKISGKSVPDNDHVDSRNSLHSSHQTAELSSDEWDVEILRLGPEGITKDLSCLLHLFCSCYSHLLLVLDDTEFYDKQVPFNLEQQKKIASLVNTLAYNTFSQNTNPQNQPLVESTVRCLHLLYERDCRRQFCPPDLWLSPGKVNRMPIAVAARTHEFFSSADAMPSSSVGSVITTMPHVFPFDERVKMFRELISMDKISRRMAGEITSPGSQSIEVVIRRSHVFVDGLRQLNNLGSRLKSAIHVSFVSESGLPEAGLDYGGLSKELLTDISKAAFSPEYGLFLQSSTSERLLVPNISARFLENGIRMIEFLGRIVGKALYEGILLDFYFSHVFVQKLLGRYSFLDELSILDPELYRNLMYVKHYDGDVEELCLDFTVTEEALGKRHVIELKPGGEDCYVTDENKLQYLHAMADYKLNRQMLPFSNAFYRGLTDLISPSWLKLFNASEFNQLLSGGDHDIDVDDLRKHTQYTGGYSDGSRTVKLFWEVVAGFQPEERCMLLKFVTSCSRAPLLGFKHLQPAFTIHKVVCDVPLWATFGGQDVDRLPSASTCYNTLKLPTYKRSSTLRAKLLYAINSNAGFELS